jgi:[citrate (pro-3S)-lyase] ligase
MFDNVYAHPVTRTSAEDMKKLRLFLASVNLNFEESVEYTCVFLDSNEQIIGTGSFEGNILKCIGIDPRWRDQGLLGKIVTHLVEKEAERRNYTVFAFTRSDNIELFKGIAMRELSRTDSFAILETGFGGIHDYETYLKKNLPKTRRGEGGRGNGCVIVNCNPFTLGHQFLLETAASKCDHLFVVVVETDLSLFPFKERIELVKRGTAHVKNLTVVKGGDYVISRYTFPTYFLRDETGLQIAAAQSELDVRLFAKWIAPVMNVRYRFVGTEDYCPTTHSYNDAMKEILPLYGIELVEVPRKKSTDGEKAISASLVREAIRKDEWELVRSLVPVSTFEFLKSPAAVGIIEKIKKSSARH